jgi:phage/conjugal plasmid C-4 type zinc finger TraR family protein
LTNDIDRASEREAEMRADALRDQALRAGLQGKTVADSAEFCEAPGCDQPIPKARRVAVPGCQYCVACQERHEKTTKGARAR